MPNIWGWKHISGTGEKPKIFNSILIFVPNIWGWIYISRMCRDITQHFSFFPGIQAKHLGDGHIFLGCV